MTRPNNVHRIHTSAPLRRSSRLVAALGCLLVAAIACDTEPQGAPTPDSDDPTEALGDAYVSCAFPDGPPFRCESHYGSSLPMVQGWGEILCFGGEVVEACTPDDAPNFAGACWLEGEMAGEWTVDLIYSYGMTVEAAESSCDVGEENSGVPGLTGRNIFFPPW